jgi:hypothetical protein
MTTTDIAGLCKRLRGEYRIPITDGLGPAGGEEPENAREFVRRFETAPIQHEAADTIERQAAEIERLRGALEPFADLADEFSVCGDGQPIGVKAVSGQSDLNVGHLRRAAEAFK